MGDDSGKSEKSLSRAVTITAIVCLAFFGGLAVALLVSAGKTSETHWSRMVFVYSGIEAVVFAAAGALFGSRVERTNTAAAEARADRAEEAAADNAKAVDAERGAAAAGRALLAAVEVEAELDSEERRQPGGTERVRGGPPRSERAGVDVSASDSLVRLARLGQRLFDAPQE